MSPTQHPESEAPGVDPVYLVRDDIAQSFNPVDAFERMLVTAASQAWLDLLQARDLQRRLYEKTDPLELFLNDRDSFQAITRHVATCERIWREALAEIHRVQRCRTARPRATKDQLILRPLHLRPQPVEPPPAANAPLNIDNSKQRPPLRR